MKFRKIVPYKLKRLIPAIALAGATIFFSGCGKDDDEDVLPDTNGTSQIDTTGTQPDTTGTQPDTSLRHNTTYYWGMDPNYGDNYNMDAIYDQETRGPTQQVIASADSAEVRYVICQHLDEDLGGTSDHLLRKGFEEIQNGIPEENRSKIRGGGELYHLGIYNPADSLWLVNFGFKIVNSFCYH